MIGRFAQRSLVAMVLMAASAGLSVFAEPNRMLADSRPAVKLDAVVPASFGEWRLDELAGTMLVQPDVQQLLDSIYAETLSRVYMNARGERIMLSIAYGRNQSDSLQVHLPEVCYQGQGFALDKLYPATIQTSFSSIPAHRMIASRQSRQEAVTYWIVVGDRIATDDWERKKVKLHYALDRTIPDGMLVRVSSISENTQDAFTLQQQFIESMLGSMSHSHRQRLLHDKAS